jgi:hypothetical protein
MGKGVESDFKQLALLRVDLLRFSGAHAEGGCVKSPHVVQNACGKCIAATFFVRRGMVETVNRKTVRGDPSNRAMAILQKRPKSLSVGRPRKPGGEPDDGNTFVV